MHVRRDATPLQRAFPLVLIAQGNRQDAPDQAVLSEFLASHGYVVASELTRALAIAAERKGAQFLDGGRVQRIAMATDSGESAARISPTIFGMK